MGHSKFIGFFDGACEPTNPNGSMGLGAILYEAPYCKISTANVELGQDHSVLFRYGKCIHRGEHGFDSTSNNVAEYLSALRLIKFLAEEGMQNENVLLCGDSQLVIKQMNGEWGMNGGIYIKYALMLKENIKSFTNLDFMWIPRELNSIADVLSKSQMIERGVKFKIQPINK